MDLCEDKYYILMCATAVIIVLCAYLQFHTSIHIVMHSLPEPLKSGHFEYNRNALVCQRNLWRKKTLNQYGIDDFKMQSNQIVGIQQNRYGYENNATENEYWMHSGFILI